MESLFWIKTKDTDMVKRRRNLKKQKLTLTRRNANRDT